MANVTAELERVDRLRGQALDAVATGNIYVERAALDQLQHMADTAVDWAAQVAALDALTIIGN